ncbi:MAG TPA: hypothetical protein VM370_08100 [Candidatus Thermoplasmatota archaeon]|nr:hypothetical protein [Candidatus Thermoplasmatota archaeon]
MVIGLLLSFSNVFGFVIGAPLMYLGWILILVGIVLGIYHLATGRTRSGQLRGPGRTV